MSETNGAELLDEIRTLRRTLATRRFVIWNSVALLLGFALIVGAVTLIGFFSGMAEQSMIDNAAQKAVDRREDPSRFADTAMAASSAAADAAASENSKPLDFSDRGTLVPKGAFDDRSVPVSAAPGPVSSKAAAPDFSDRMTPAGQH